MDWIIDSRPAGSQRALDLLGEHLRRHATDPGAVDVALSEIDATIADALSDADGRPVRARLDWTRTTPTLELSAVRDPAALGPEVAADAPVPARHRPRVRALDAEPLAETPLAVVRTSRAVFVSGPPPTVGVQVDVRTDGVASVPVAMAAVHEAHPTLTAPQVAAAAGALLAGSVLGDDAAPLAPGRAAEVIVEVHKALGGDAHVVAADEDVLEIAMGSCPFGAVSGDADSLCYLTTGLAGHVGSRVRGRAAVVLDESVALGDPECHLQVILHDVDDAVAGETHVWPPAVSDPADPVPHFDMAISLPRESASVPVVRRLAAQALRAFGVTEEDVDDVQLAITEACANVIDHAADTDTYDVKVELAADRCAITVLDQGGGFDAARVPARPEDNSDAGRGLLLMRALVDNIAFTNEPQAGAVVHMVKALTYDMEHPLHRI